MQTFRNFLKPYIPHIILKFYRFILMLISKLRCLFIGFRVNERSRIYEILREKWENYRKDLIPNDRRMRILEEKGVVGMSTENIRLFINEAVRRFAKDGTYLEVGTLHGCSLLSAALFNASTRCFGVDNFSKFDPEGENALVLKKNLEKFDNPKNIEFLNQDYEKAIQYLFSKEPNLKVDIYYYDGKHTYEDQIKGLRIMLPNLANKCIIFVDDLNWKDVQRANQVFIKENREFKSMLKILTKENGSNDWWNGFEVITRGI